MKRKTKKQVAAALERKELKAYIERFPNSREAREAAEAAYVKLSRPKRVPKRKLTRQRLAEAFAVVAGNLVALEGMGGSIQAGNVTKKIARLDGMWLWEAQVIHMLGQ